MKTLIRLEDRYVKFNLLDMRWTAYLFTVKEYERFVDKGSAATTFFESKAIVFKLDELTPEVINHELIHALVHCSIGSTKLKSEDLEEVLCEQISQHGTRINRLANKIYKSLLVFLK